MNGVSIQRFALKVSRWVREKRGQTGQTYVWHRVEQYRQMWKACAGRLGATFIEHDRDFWELQMKSKRVRICNDILPFDDAVVLEIAGRKPLVYNLLSRHHLPIPNHACFDLDTLSVAHDFFNRHPHGCVIKPASGTSSGQGVTTHITESRAIRSAAILASLFDRDLVIEQMIPGECYRVLVLNGRAVHAVGRRGPRLVADGISQVESLIKRENSRRKRGGLYPLTIDDDCLFTLAYQNLSLDSTPTAGTDVLIKSVDNPMRSTREVRTVYNSDVFGEMHDSILRQAELAAVIVGSSFVGVDVICRDCTLPLDQTGGVINEVNTTPGMHHHYDSGREQYPQAALLALCALLEIPTND